MAFRASSSSPEAGRYQRSYSRTLSWCLVITLGPVLFGLDQAALNGSIVIATFRERFGSKDATTGGYIITADQQTSLLAVFLAGAIIASVVSGPIGTSLGRKAGFYCCIVTSILGAIIQIVANHLGVVILGRIISGAGLGFAANFCGVYWSEVAPAHWRGIIIMAYQGFINLAAFIGACIVQGVYSLNNNWAWRTILMVMMIAPLLLACFMPWLPESPRWYVTRGRREDARKALGQLRGPTWPGAELDAEIDEIVAMFELERQLEGSKTYADCFKKTDLRRTTVVFVVAAAQEFTGYSFIAGYGTLFFAISGLTNPFVITVISSCCALAGSFCAFPLVKYFGRRILLLTGSVVCTLCMYLFAIVAVVKPNSIIASKFLVAAVCIYTFTYGATWGPVPTTIITEIPSNGLRSKTMSMTACIAWSVAMLIACGTPYLVSPAYANIGAKLGFVFGSTLFIWFIILIFVLPETKDRTLEEIDEMFLNRVPTGAFEKYVCTKEIRDSENHLVATVASVGQPKLSQDTTTDKVRDDKVFPGVSTVVYGPE